MSERAGGWMAPKGGDSADPDGPWEFGHARCAACLYVGVAVRPFSVDDTMECPRCGSMRMHFAVRGEATGGESAS